LDRVFGPSEEEQRQAKERHRAWNEEWARRLELQRQRRAMEAPGRMHDISDLKKGAVPGRGP
jgi:hypothetical protein